MSTGTESFCIPDHTLLGVIGRGSYGEVWLARNVMGTLRAVKIVRRAAFETDRPYLREFEGIRRCEPISRAHDGLIDILHMGRHDDEGWFYYVMELADAAGGASESEGVMMGNGDAQTLAFEPLSTIHSSLSPSYTPATLAERIGGGPRMDVTEFLRLAESVAGALAFLHERGLIHRDVKPSNILYVGGVAKLGDIGLMAEAGSSRSHVGTEGYVPMEGPGTERADIFALGKVLYEALTGLDRSRFPRLPPDWTEAYEFEQRLELNEIVLRACEGDTVRRYHSAREMLADVALIASGGSVRRMRGMERRLRWLKWIARSVAVLALAALGVSGIWRQQAGRERTLRVRAQQAESAEREAHLSALLNQVHAARHDPSPGAVTGALKVAGEAAALHVTPELRDDAIFLLSRPDFRMRPDLGSALTHSICTLDADSGLMAEMPEITDASPGPLLIAMHTAGAPEKKRILTVPNAPAGLSMLQLSRGGQRLLVTGEYGTGIVLDTATGDRLPTQPFPPSYPFGTPLTFLGSGGNALIRRASDGGLAIYRLPGGERQTTPPLGDWPVRNQGQQPQRLWPSPDGRFVLLIDDELQLPSGPGNLPSIPAHGSPAKRGAACLAEIATGRVLWKASGPDEQAAAWSQDGTRVAVRADDRILSLNAATGQIEATVPQRIINRGTQFVFLDTRDILAFSTWSVNGLCDLAREVILGRPAALERWSYSRERGLLFAATGRAEWRPSPVLRILRPPQIGSGSVFFSFSPKEDWCIVGHTSTFAWWRMDKGSSEPDVILPAQGAANVLFSADEKAAHFLTNDGRHEGTWTGEPPASLPGPLPYGPGASGRSDYTNASRDGKVLAFGGYRYVIVWRQGEEPRSFPTDDSSNPVGLSPDGRWLAVGAFQKKEVRIFDLMRSDGEPVHQETCGVGCFPCFSPDGKWLACSGFADNRILETNTWTVVHRRPRASSSLLGHISFSKDGRLMSVKENPTRCAIIEPGTWRTLFQLDSPLDETFERCALSATGRYFAAVGTRSELYVWDLHALERELTALGLGALSQ